MKQIQYFPNEQINWSLSFIHKLACIHKKRFSASAANFMMPVIRNQLRRLLPFMALRFLSVTSNKNDYFRAIANCSEDWSFLTYWRMANAGKTAKASVSKTFRLLQVADIVARAFKMLKPRNIFRFLRSFV